jgi:DNA-binding GntR family transcriptional regulator
LCDLAMQVESSQELRNLMEKWVAAASAMQPSDSEIAAAEDAFAEFSRACKLHFFDVDKQLKELCSRMTEVASPLTSLLTVMN